MNDKNAEKTVHNHKPIAARIDGAKGGREAYQARFNRKVDKSCAGGCWEWRGTLNRGYGSIGGLMAHRIAYYLAHGLDPGDLLVRHDCDNKPCVNPAHLQLGTQADNMRDARVRGRSARGERSGNSKLRAADVLDLRVKYQKGVSQPQLAAEYGVTQPNVSYIINRVTWAHLPEAA